MTKLENPSQLDVAGPKPRHKTTQVMVGNVAVGGGALVGLAYAYIGRSTRAARISPAAAGSRRELDPMDELEGQLERPALVPQGARLSPAPAE